MKWFKFYGQDWLTDTKVLQMTIEDKLCFITLLCLASSNDDEKIKNCTEETIIRLTQLYENPYDDDNEVSRARGVLNRLEKIGMITNDNGNDITILNFMKRQGQSLTGYERVKRYREKQKSLLLKDKINDNNDNGNDNARIDKNRKDITAKAVKLSIKKKTMKTINYDTGDYEEEKEKTHKRQDVIKLAKLFDEMASKYSEKPIITGKSYFIVLNAINKHKMTPKGIEVLYDDWFSNNKVKLEDKVKMSFCLSSSNINSFKTKN